MSTAEEKNANDSEEAICHEIETPDSEEEDEKEDDDLATCRSILYAVFLRTCNPTMKKPSVCDLCHTPCLAMISFNVVGDLASLGKIETVDGQGRSSARRAVACSGSCLPHYMALFNRALKLHQH
jgi:hypothetical protein